MVDLIVPAIARQSLDIVRFSAKSPTDQFGPVIKLVYTGSQITEVKQGSPKVDEPA